MATLNIFELDARPHRMPPVVILAAATEHPIVWRLLPLSAGWVHVHACGRKVHQWAGPVRPQSVQCPGCKGWVAAP